MSINQINFKIMITYNNHNNHQQHVIKWWINYHNSLTWKVQLSWGCFPLLTMIIVSYSSEIVDNLEIIRIIPLTRRTRSFSQIHRELYKSNSAKNRSGMKWTNPIEISQIIQNHLRSSKIIQNHHFSQFFWVLLSLTAETRWMASQVPAPAFSSQPP